MKYIISYCIAVLLTILLAGCTETTKIGPETPEGPAYVEVSSDKLIFDADGGSVSIVVATNAAAWDYTSTGDWFIVTRKEDNTLAVETSINAGPETLTGSIVVSGEKNGDQVSATVSLVQRAERSINLSAEGTSNCYIAHTGKAYKFDASVKGNGKGDGRSDYIAAYGTGISGVAAAELLWESRNDGDKTMSREIIDGAPDSNNIPAYNETNYEVGNGSGSWIFNATTLPLTTPPGNIPNAIQNPMTYLQPYYSDHYNWYCASKDEKVTHSGLWGPEKTIFDPCPVGYKVPGSNLWGIPSGNTSLRNGGPVEDYDENGVSDKWDWNKAEDCGRRWKNTGDYYPMVGNVYYLSINKTTHNYTGGQAFYWTCQPTPVTTSADCYRQDFNDNWAIYQTGAHVYSAQVRCVKE